ncbi:DUF2637 domain-containing protein [Streptomyces xanthophaeus]|nr:DUF2637 domain-containing protein [Streptomyces xanthophaeus]
MTKAFTGARKTLAMAVGVGSLIIAGIGFAGSYAAVVDLARRKGFGDFALVFPIGIDAGIAVLLALDLLLSWIRMPFPLLRHMAWMLTAATITFNGAAAWPDPLAVGMHSVMPVLFVVVVEAVRHAVGRLANITADKHMDSVRIWRWILSPLPTAKLWRRMKLWELRSYEQALGLDQDRLVYEAHLQARYGPAWRWKAPVEALLPLRLARIGVPLTDTAAAGLAAAGIEIKWRSAATAPALPPETLPAFEEHTLGAVAVVGQAVISYADTPTLPQVPIHPEDAEEFPSIRALVPARTHAFAAEDKPRKNREEVTARIPADRDLEEDMPECQDTGHADGGQAEEPSPSPAPGGAAKQANRSDAASAKTQVPPVSPEPGSPLTERNARAAEEGAKRRVTYALGWHQVQLDKPTTTQTEYAKHLGISTRTLRRAIHENTPA